MHHRLATLLAFASAVTLTNACNAQTLNGLYLQNQSIGRGNVWHYYYFWPDGRMCNVMPKGGMNPVPTYAAVSAANPGECGTFSLRSGTLQLQSYGGSKPASLKLDHVDNSGFALSGFPTIKVPAYPNGATLNGTWKTLIINGSDYRNQSFTFGSDGSYSFDDVPVRSVGAPARHAKGTYRISGNTLQVVAGGATQVMSIHGFPNDPRISLDGNVIERR